MGALADVGSILALSGVRPAHAMGEPRTCDPEPTAALDAKAEHDVFARVMELGKGRAVLLISHRFSTVRMADEIVGRSLRTCQRP